jgi:hypothetical protein
MFKILFSLSVIIVIIIACSSTKHAKNAMIKQGLSGCIYEVTGNQMPMKGEDLAKPRGISIEIFIYEATNITQVQKVGTSSFYNDINTKLITSVTSDSTGKFSVALPVGNYSIFIKIGKQFFANRFNERNDINLYSVKEDEITEATVTVNYAATY